MHAGSWHCQFYWLQFRWVEPFASKIERKTALTAKLRSPSFAHLWQLSLRHDLQRLAASYPHLECFRCMNAVLDVQESFMTLNREKGQSTGLSALCMEHFGLPLSKRLHLIFQVVGAVVWIFSGVGGLDWTIFKKEHRVPRPCKIVQFYQLSEESNQIKWFALVWRVPIINSQFLMRFMHYFKVQCISINSYTVNGILYAIFLRWLVFPRHCCVVRALGRPVTGQPAPWPKNSSSMQP